MTLFDLIWLWFLPTILYIWELTLGFETNIELNSKRKAMKYDPLIQDIRSQYCAINFINLSMSALGIYDASSDTILTMMNDPGIDNSVQKSIIKKIINIAVRSTYYIFCRRNNTWPTQPCYTFKSKIAYSYIHIYSFPIVTFFISFVDHWSSLYILVVYF